MIMNLSRYRCISKQLFRLQQRSISAVFVSDLLKDRPKLACVSDKTLIKGAAQLLEEHKTGALMVTNYEDRVVGIITSRDIQRAVANYDVPNLTFCKTTDVMTTKENLSFAKATDSVETVAAMMQKRNIRHVPVINDDFECLAMLSFKDVIDEVLKHDAEQKEKRMTGR